CRRSSSGNASSCSACFGVCKLTCVLRFGALLCRGFTREAPPSAGGSLARRRLFALRRLARATLAGLRLAPRRRLGRFVGLGPRARQAGSRLQPGVELVAVEDHDLPTEPVERNAA